MSMDKLDTFYRKGGVFMIFLKFWLCNVNFLKVDYALVSRFEILSHKVLLSYLSASCIAQIYCRST